MNRAKENINSLLCKCEPLIINVSKDAPDRFRDEIRQRMRIWIWQYLQKKYDYKESVEEFIRGYNNRLIYKIYRTCFIGVVVKYCKYYRKHFVLKDDAHLIAEDSVYNYDNVQYKATLNKLMECLTDDERYMIKYILKFSGKNINCEQLARQWGYAKEGGAVRYIISGIFDKMRKFAKKKGIKVEFSQ